MYDIGIVGMGPAGATLARLLGEKYKVLVVDRKQPDAEYGKCCGGLLALDAQKSLAKFSLTLPRDILVTPQIFAVRTIDLRYPLERYYQRFYVNLDRGKFDNWLASLIPPSVTVLRGALCKSVKRVSGGFALTVQQGGEIHTYGVKALVGADGAGSLTRRAFFPDKGGIRRYVAIQEWYEGDKMDPFYASVFDPEITDCYCWTIHKEGRLVVGGAFPQQNATRRFQLLKEKLKQRGYRFGHRVRREGCLVYRPGGMGSFATARDRAFLVGEAAGFISPSSLEGLSYAMDSGYLLARALEPGLHGAETRYTASTRGIRLGLLSKHLKVPFMYQPLLRRLVMRSGLDSIHMA